ncbi:MAG: universal stress protein [Gelidibacter sp.]
MRHHILIPSDFSDNAWSAALYALKLYANKPCTFYFSHTWTFLNSGSRTYISPSYIEPLKEKAREQLAELKERAQLESKNNDHDFETIFSEGELIDSIELGFKTHHVDLVIMGTKGATGGQKILLGSNTVTVIKKIKRCPVLLVPNNYEYITPKNIAFPTDFNRIYGEELLPLKQLAELQNSTIKILHISDKDRDDLTDKQTANLEILKTNLENYQYSFNWVPVKGNKEQTIKDFNDKNAIDLITMINYKHSFIESIIREPIIKKLGFQSKIPFLVIPGIN